MQKNKPENILIIQLGDIGDLILTFPCIRAVKEAYPASNIIVAVRDKARDLVDLCEWSDGVIEVSTEKRGLLAGVTFQKRFIEKLRSYKFDLSIDMRTGTRGAIMSWLSGAKRRIAFFSKDEGFWRNRIFTDLVRAKYIINQHMVDYNLGVLEPLAISTDFRFPEITIDPNKMNIILQKLLPEDFDQAVPIIAIQPFSLWEYKEWGIDKFAELITWLKNNYQCLIVITGGPAEKEKAAQLNNIVGESVLSVVGKTSIGQYAELLSACKLLISVDSAGPHIAAATGTRTITIYGPGSPEVWAPRGEKHMVVRNSMTCVPCNKAGCHGLHTSRCIETLNLEDVSIAVQKQMVLVQNDS